MPERYQKKLDELTVSLNRLTAQKAHLMTTLKKDNNTERKARTRTLIQLGGLMDVSGLLNVFDICAGDDLERDATKSDNGAALLGCLITVMEQMPAVISDNDKGVFIQKGIRALTRRNYAKRESNDAGI